MADKNAATCAECGNSIRFSRRGSEWCWIHVDTHLAKCADGKSIAHPGWVHPE